MSATESREGRPGTPPSWRRLVLVLVLALGTGSLLAPPVASLAARLRTRPFTFARVYDRVVEVSAGVALVACRRWIGFSSLASVGLGSAGAGAALGVGLAVAAGGATLVLGVSAAGGAVTPRLRYPPRKAVRKAAAGALAAFVIAGGEELLFRGILLSALVPALGARGALGLSSLVYAAVHFLRGGREIGRSGVAWWTGFERALYAARPLADPAVLPGLVGLFTLGLVLGATFLWSRNLALPVGLHAGWLLAVRVGRVGLHFAPRRHWFYGLGHPRLVSGVLGWSVLLLTLAVIRVLLRSRGPQPGRPEVARRREAR